MSDPKDLIPTIQRPRRRRYSIVNLRFTGNRSIVTSTLRSSPTRQLQVVPDVVDLPFSDPEEEQHCVSRPETPPRVIRPLTDQEARVVSNLLPPQQPYHAGKLTLVLDLDETLVHAALPQSEEVPTSPHDFSFLIDDVLGSTRSREVIVWKRPGLSKFLARASQFAEIVVFTASLKGTVMRCRFAFASMLTRVMLCRIRQPADRHH